VNKISAAGRFLAPLFRFLARHRADLIRAAVVASAFAWIMPPVPRVVMGPPQTVQTEQPLVCVHTRLTDEVEEWKIQRTLRLVREMGAPAIVEYFAWAYIEVAPGRFSWGHADTVIAHAHNQGLRVIARLGMVPGWAQPDEGETTVTSLNPERYDDFARFAAAFAARYADRLEAIIVWNEPNLSFEWGYQAVDPAGYADMLRAVYPAIKDAAPGVTVLGGALAPTREPVGSPHGMNDLDYLRGMLEAGAAQYMDALAAHTYGLTFPPESPPDPDVVNFRRLELLREILREYDAPMPIYITEGGWNDHPRWTHAVKPGQRIAYTVGAFAWAAAHWPDVESVCVWAFRYPAPVGNNRDYYTFVTSGFRVKRIYEEVQKYARGWE
jgi:hypothetical protein